MPASLRMERLSCEREGSRREEGRWVSSSFELEEGRRRARTYAKELDSVRKQNPAL